MDDITQNIVKFSNHIVANIPMVSPKNISEYCTSRTETGHILDGLLGFYNHSKFLPHLFGGQRDKKKGGQVSSQFPSVGLLARIGLSRATASQPNYEKLEIVSKTQITPGKEDAEEEWAMGKKSESWTRKSSPVLSMESASVDNFTSNYSDLKETFVNTEQVNSGAAVSREELGRATWTFLHTLAAQFPEHPTKGQRHDVKELMGILSRIYPCKECADHFKAVLKTHPVETQSGKQLAQWMCRVHNVVNRSLGKAQFPCHLVDLRWGALDCSEYACDLQGRYLHK